MEIVIKNEDPLEEEEEEESIEIPKSNVDNFLIDDEKGSEAGEVAATITSIECSKDTMKESSITGIASAEPMKEDSVPIEEEQKVDEEEEKASLREIKREDNSNVNWEAGLKDEMKRMAAENDKLKGLLTELCERNAQQCSLMGGLAKRIEQLAQAVQNMRTKKKRRSSSSDCSSLDTNSRGGQKKQQ